MQKTSPNAEKTADLLAGVYVVLWRTLDRGGLDDDVAYDISRAFEGVSAAYRSLTGKTIGKAAGLSD